MKKFFSLVLALVMALSLTTVAWGADVAKIGDTGYATVREALVAAKDGDTITILEGNYTIGDFTHEHFYANGDVTPKNLTIVGQGDVTLDALYFNTNPFPENLTVKNITFDGANLAGTPDTTRTAPAAGIFSSTNVVGLTVDECSFINGAYLSLAHATATDVVVDTCVFDGVASASSAIYIQNANGVTVTNCTVKDGGYNAIQLAKNVSGVIEIYDNTFSNTSDRAIRLDVVQSGAALIIKDNTVVNGTDADGEVLKATSIADDVYVEAIGNNWGGGKVVNDELADSASSNNGTTGVYAKGTYAGATAEAVDVKYYKAVDNKVDTKTGAWKANGTVEYYTLSIDTMKYAKVATLGEADVAIYTDAACKNAYLYLKAIDVVYYGDGAVFTNFGDMCGQYDEDDTDFDDEATYYTAFNELYVGVEPGVGYDVQLMVNGQLVQVDAVNNITKLAHKAMVTTDKKGNIESIKCPVCGLQAVKAGNYASIPAAVVAANLVVTGPDAAGAYWYFPVATAAGTTTTDKTVTSAETFDAGIAMYVGMSVMAAAGSAVVLKKKDN